MSGAAAARAARETVLLVATDRAGLVATGKDRVSWLNGLVTCELAKLAPGEAAYGLLVEKKGRIQTDLFVLQSTASPTTLALAVPPALREALLVSLDHYLIMEDVELSSSEMVFWLAHGPRAAELVGLAPFEGKVDLLGHGGAVLGAPAADAETLAASLRDAVARLGGEVGSEADWEAVRIEHGLPRFGVEVDATFYPQEASLEKVAVSFSKGCYLGQEVIYMLQERGHVKQKLVSLDLEGDDVPPRGAPVTTPAGDVVGDVRSAVRGPTSGKPTAIAMVKWGSAKAGTDLRVAGVAAHVR